MWFRQLQRLLSNKRIHLVTPCLHRSIRISMPRKDWQLKSRNRRDWVAKQQYIHASKYSLVLQYSIYVGRLRHKSRLTEEIGKEMNLVLQYNCTSSIIYRPFKNFLKSHLFNATPLFYFISVVPVQQQPQFSLSVSFLYSNVQR